MSENKKSVNLWPYAIFGGYGLFAVVAVGGAILLSRDSVDLVSPDYYAQEIKYESRLDAFRAAARPGHGFHIGPVRDGVIVLQRPAAATNDFQGTVTLYRPSDGNLDQSWPIAFPDGPDMRLPVAGLKSGVWRMQLAWESDKTAHYQEFDLTLP